MTVLRTKGLYNKVTEEEYATFERLTERAVASQPSVQSC
jgi:hypothetical protein